MRHPGLASFAATLSILAPVALLSAGPEQRAKLFVRGERTVVVDGARVDISLDRAVADEGQTIHLALHADKRAKIGVVVLGSPAHDGERVPTPPHEVFHRTLTVDGTADVAIPLHGAEITSDHPLGLYSIYVMAPRRAAELDHIASRAHDPVYSGDEPIPAPGAGSREAINAKAGVDDDVSAGVEDVARVDAVTRAVDPDISLSVPDRVAPGETFDVAVTVANSSTKPLPTLELAIDTPRLDSFGDEYLALASDHVTIDGGGTFGLAPHETRVLHARVTADEAGVLAIHASVTCAHDDELPYDKQPPCWAGYGLYLGALDAVDIGESPVHILAGG